jgi:tetratricopeptide (TPR) repeat protein
VVRFLLLFVFSQISDYDRGVALFEKGDLDGAIPLLAKAAQDRPNDAKAWKALGVVHAAKGAYESAEPAFGRACDIDPKLEDACYYHARALYALNRFEPSLAALERIQNRTSKVQLAAAQSLEALGRADEAEKAYKNSLSDGDPKPGVAYGLFLVRQGRFIEAVTPLRSVLARFPKNSEAHTYLGRALLEQGEIANSITHLELAVKIDPRSAQAHLLLAKAYVRAGRADKAKPHFEAAARSAH